MTRSRHVLPLVLATLAALTLPGAARAQEVQVPLDESGRLLEIDRGLAQRLGLFLDRYPDLQVVRLYERAAGDFVLEVTRRADGRSVRDRVPLSAEEAGELRARVTAALGEQAPRIALDQEGRYLLLGTTTLLGLGFYGWAVPAVLDVETGRGILAAYMLTAGASFVLPYLYTRDRPVSYGMANAGFWGATRGALHGLYLAELLGEPPSESVAAGLGMGVSLAEGLAAYNWARATDMSAGRAHTIGNFGDFGHTWAAAGMAVIQPRQEEPVLASLLAGSALGLVLGNRRSRVLPYTWGDAEVQRLAFTLGAANGAVVWDWIFGDNASDDETRVLGAALLAGSVGGMLFADRQLEGHDFSVGQAILVDLGTVAGGLLGVGVAVLLSPDQIDDPTPLLTLAAAGANLGYLATFYGLSGEARRNAERERGRFGLELNPGALLLLSDRHPARRLGREVQAPLFALRYRF